LRILQAADVELQRAQAGYPPAPGQGGRAGPRDCRAGVKARRQKRETHARSESHPSRPWSGTWPVLTGWGGGQRRCGATPARPDPAAANSTHCCRCRALRGAGAGLRLAALPPGVCQASGFLSPAASPVRPELTTSSPHGAVLTCDDSVQLGPRFDLVDDEPCRSAR